MIQPKKIGKAMILELNIDQQFTIQMKGIKTSLWQAKMLIKKNSIQIISD